MAALFSQGPLPMRRQLKGLESEVSQGLTVVLTQFLHGLGRSNYLLDGIQERCGFLTRWLHHQVRGPVRAS